MTTEHSELSSPPPGRVAVVAPAPLRPARQRMIAGLADADDLSVVALIQPRERLDSNVTKPESWRRIQWSLPLGRGVATLSSDQRAELKALDVNLLLWLLDQPLDDPVASELAYGVWSFHRAPAPRGLTPIGVDEVLDGATSFGVVLCHSDGTRHTALRTARLAARPWSQSDTREQLDLALESWPRLAWTGRRAQPRASDVHEHPPPVSSSRLRLRFVERVRRVRQLATRAIEREEWAIGVIQASPASVALNFDPGAIEWMPESPAGFVADPFPIASERGATILAEQFDHSTELGCIVAVDFDRVEGFATPRRVFAPPFHVSYPFPIPSDDGTSLILPETIALNTVTLFKVTPTLEDWTVVETLISGRQLADATLLERNGRHWLFALDTQQGSECALVIFHAPSLLGPWEPHRANPVKVDVASARPAGPFIEDGDRLLRPGQDSSTTYGGRIVVHEVVELSESAFEEHPIAVIEPDADGPYPRGIHTIAGIGELTVVDGKRMVRMGPLATARRVARRLWSRSRADTHV